MRFLLGERWRKDVECARAADFTEAVRLYGVNVRKTFVGVVVVETDPARVVIQSDYNKRPASQPETPK